MLGILHSRLSLHDLAVNLVELSNNIVLERVFVVSSGQARLRLVKTAGLHEGRVVISAGLDAGETVVLDAPASLRDGQPVNIQP